MLEIALDEARGKRVLVALSGGADSVALLFLLCRAREAGMLRVCAAHFEHGIRGEESARDMVFCQKLCERTGVPLVIRRADVPRAARETGRGCEACARELRHEFLAETALEVGADLIALGHHRDDQAETVLMHLLRGTGPEGIRGMRRLSGNLFRPLLDVRKAEIVAFLEDLGEAWREDQTNRAPDNPRNLLRLRAIPELERAYPGAAAALCRYAEAAQIEDAYVSEGTDRFCAERVETLPHGRRIDLSGSPEEALVRRALRRACGRELSSDKLRELLCLKTGTDIASGMRAERHGAHLYVLGSFDRPAARVLNIPGTTILDGICRMTIAPCAPEPERTRKSAQVLGARALEGAVLRTRLPGDWIAPLGMAGTKSLSDYYTDRKLDPPLRDIAPVVARGSEILWAVGFGISRNCALGDSPVRPMGLEPMKRALADADDRAVDDRGEIPRAGAAGCEAVRLTCDYTGWGGFVR